MFDISAGEFLVIGAIALIAIGPKELPGMLRTVGQTVGKMKRMAGDFRQQFDDAMREADLHEAQKSMQDAVDTASAATSFNPISTIRNEIKSTVDELKGVKAAEAAPAEQGPPVMTLDPVPEVTSPVVSVPVEPVAEAAPAPVETKPARAKRAKKTEGGDAA